jgi:alkaline phosphatase
MNHSKIQKLPLISSVLLCAGVFISQFAASTVIYPLNHASILVGSKFDLKVEYEKVIDPLDMLVQLNGQPITKLISSKPEYIQNENGKGSSLIWRNVSLNKAANYHLTAGSISDPTMNREVDWDVYATGPRKVKNVILFIGDGMSIANRTAARVLSKGIVEGKFQGKLSFDDMPYSAMIGTSGADSLITDSANSASAYTTGHKSSVNALGVYASRATDNLAHPKVETIVEILKRKTKMSVGIVSDAEIEDATPAAMVAHTRRRADKQYIADQLFQDNIEVILGGGGAYFLPQKDPKSKRKDNNNLVRLFQGDGYTVVRNKTELMAANNDTHTKKLFGVFHDDNMDGSLDRFFLKKNTVSEYPDQPDLTDMTQSAINVLSKNKEGFFLMVEAGLIDKFNHPLDWERAAFDTIMLSNAVQIAKDYAFKHKDTMVIVTPDHTHSGSIMGVIHDDKAGPLREKVGIYADAGFPNYPKANAQGYPETIDVSKRMVFQYANGPEHYETMRPKLDGTFVPAVKDPKDSSGKTYIANPKYKEQNDDAYLVPGNIPATGESGVHTVDDALLNAMGPGAEKFRGFMDNTEVFRTMVDALGLGK